MDEKIVYQDETYLIQGAIFEVYKTVGSGFLEGVYQESLALEFRLRGIPFVEHQELFLHYKGYQLRQTYIPDFICYNKIIVELKAVSNLLPEHEAQLLNYLRITDMRLGLLVNFGAHRKVDIRRRVL